MAYCPGHLYFYNKYVLLYLAHNDTICCAQLVESGVGKRLRYGSKWLPLSMAAIWTALAFLIAQGHPSGPMCGERISLVYRFWVSALVGLFTLGYLEHL